MITDNRQMILKKKQIQLTELSELREELKKKPRLKHLFLELTLRCNERCLHCGSSCGDVESVELTVEDYRKFLTDVARDFDVKDFMLNITGGEPLLRKDFFEIMQIAHDLGYRWGMTSNGTLITPEVARKLKEVGMRTISISIDGTEKTHDAFRRTPGGYKRALEGVQNLIDVGGFDHIQVTTVVTHKNINELDDVFKVLDKIDIDSWRVTEISPIGRANQHTDLYLTPDDAKRLVNYIRDMRAKGYPLCYGCDNFLGLEYEHEIRDWYFLCMAGICVASICCNGDMVSCLDIERRPEFVQGNILRDNFTEVWYNKYKEFRIDLSDLNEKCKNCEQCKFCHGGSFHTWNFNESKPNVCYKGVLFD